MLLQGKETPYDTEIFSSIMEKLKELSKTDDIKSRRIVAEHLRASIMIIADGGRPSNIDRGYILRRLIRRMIRHLNKLGIDYNEISNLIDLNINVLSEMYPELVEKKEIIKNVIIEEKNKFIKTLSNGEKEFEKEIIKAQKENRNVLDGATVFRLYETYGFPTEFTKELAEERGFKVNLEEIEELFKKHQEKSRLGSEQKFKGGLADQNEVTICYHTATHLLHKALKIVLGDHVNQAGSNITNERMRFDFTHPQKVTKEELEKVENIVNEQIARGLDVVCEEMSLEEAKKSGAIGLFENKYGDRVKVYTIGDFSKEICGGPHVSNTKELGTFKIKKEEASSAGVRRIKAILIKLNIV
jgi:alanyl-tRNA synthetase